MRICARRARKAGLMRAADEGDPMANPSTVLICGAGSRGRTVYGRFAQRRPDLARVVAVAEPDPVRRQHLAREHAIAPEFQFAHWSEAAGKGRIADVAIVATDDRSHVEPAVALLDLGYHLLLEKPMAPDLDGCQAIVEASKRSTGLSAICHVLRYSAYFRALKRMLDNGAVGQPVTIRHLEPVNFWHFAHSFVRGNWNRRDTSSPFILAKCCHDMDILLYLTGRRPVSLHSFGSLTHFRKEAAPAGHSPLCQDCSLESRCVYSAPRFYGAHLQAGNHGWPLNVVTEDFTPEGLSQALRTGPYGRCVYECDNDAPDHQVVQILFEGGLTASLTATAFTDHRERETEILGTQGSLTGDGQSIVHMDFLTRSVTRHRIEAEGAHLGGDDTMLGEFFTAVAQGRPDLISTSPQVSLESHRMALLAEQSRLSGQMLEFT
jgi:predicted dehydrogenase